MYDAIFMKCQLSYNIPNPNPDCIYTHTPAPCTFKLIVFALSHHISTYVSDTELYFNITCKQDIHMFNIS